jgi:hypothetical protein
MPPSLAYCRSRRSKKKTLAAGRFIEKTGETLENRVEVSNLPDFIQSIDRHFFTFSYPLESLPTGKNRAVSWSTTS